MGVPNKFHNGFMTRRQLIAAGAALAVTAPSLSHAQSMDPWDYMTTMESKPDFGTPVGQPAVDEIEDQGARWNAYLQMPIKEGQDFHFTCEFDSAWIILKAYGFDVPLDEQLAIVGVDESIEPYFEETAEGYVVYGGDLDTYFCGHIDENVLARARCNAMRKVFEAKGLSVSVTPDRPSIEAALLRGEPVFFKSTVDFMPWRPAVWHTPDGDTFPVVLTNDHALTVMGFNGDDVIIRDPLGPTTTNWERPWQWKATWTRFLEVLAAQGNDAIAIGPPLAPSTPTG